jgi:Cupin-like domain
MLNIVKKTRVVEGCSAGDLPVEILSSVEPVILKGLVSTWGLAKAGLQSDAAAYAYLRSFSNNSDVTALVAPAEAKGRYYYNDDLSGFNFKNVRIPFNDVLDKLQLHSHDECPPGYYVGSTTVDACLPGIRAENDINFKNSKPLISIWFGNPSRIACHYDAPTNLACCVVGKRRFTLFAPEQIHNVYPGPLDFNPAGQAISMVDFANPDYQKFPRFADAVASAQVAELEAGDALLLPSMWWHHVEGLSPFNVLINYWWREVPAFMGQGITALQHAMLSIRDLPEQEKLAWKALFDYYIFSPAAHANSHIPESVQSMLASLDDLKARQLRALLINRLNR